VIGGVQALRFVAGAGSRVVVSYLYCMAFRTYLFSSHSSADESDASASPIRMGKTPYSMEGGSPLT
jgi:hypothetical protein